MIRPRSTASRALIAVCVLAGCGEEETAPAPTPPPVLCAEGEVLAVDGACLAPGADAGIPPDGCGDGFTSDGRAGCEPVLPAAPCGDGTMAVPGEDSCHELAPCGDAPWGAIPVESNTEHVDEVFTGASDGSAAAPWTTITEAITAADEGAIIAIAAGSYVEDVVIEDKAVRLWGRCPALVELRPAGMEVAVINIDGPVGVEVHDLAITGDKGGIASFGSEDLLVSRVWIHDLTTRGMNLQNDDTPTSVRVEDCLIERVADFGIYVAGSTLSLERSSIRGTRAPANLVSGNGILVRERDGEPSHLELRGSILEDNQQTALNVDASTAIVEGSVLRDTQALPDGTYGWGIGVRDYGNLRGSVVIGGSIIERNRQTGIALAGSDLEMDTTVVRDTLAQPFDNLQGQGITAQLGETMARSSILVKSSLIERNLLAGFTIVGTDATIADTVIRDHGPNAEDVGYGLIVSSDAGVQGVLDMTGCRVEGNSVAGILVHGGQATVLSTRITATRPGKDGVFGWGLSVQRTEDGVVGHAIVKDCVIEDHHDWGMIAINSTLEVDHSVVTGTLPGIDGLFGDAIGGVANVAPALITVTATRASDNHRAGIATYGAAFVLRDDDLGCNQVPIAASDGLLGPWDFTDGGGNRCDCGDQARECKAQSAEVRAPDPLEPGL